MEDYYTKNIPIDLEIKKAIQAIPAVCSGLEGGYYNLIVVALVDCDVVYDNYNKLSKTIIFMKLFIFLQILFSSLFIDGTILRAIAFENAFIVVPNDNDMTNKSNKNVNTHLCISLL